MPSGRYVQIVLVYVAPIEWSIEVCQFQFIRRRGYEGASIISCRGVEHSVSGGDIDNSVSTNDGATPAPDSAAKAPANQQFMRGVAHRIRHVPSNKVRTDHPRSPATLLCRERRRSSSNSKSRKAVVRTETDRIAPYLC